MASLTVMMVAEKPMLAESIARFLADGRVEKRKGKTFCLPDSSVSSF